MSYHWSFSTRYLPCVVVFEDLYPVCLYGLSLLNSRVGGVKLSFDILTPNLAEDQHNLTLVYVFQWVANFSTCKTARFSILVRAGI